MDEITVSIVNYNAGDYLLRCLKSLEKITDNVKLKIFIVDNNSSDNSIEKAKKELPFVKFIINSENVGFGKAHNQVLKSLNSEYVLILDADMELEYGNITKLLEY